MLACGAAGCVHLLTSADWALMVQVTCRIFGTLIVRPARPNSKGCPPPSPSGPTTTTTTTTTAGIYSPPSTGKRGEDSVEHSAAAMASDLAPADALPLPRIGTLGMFIVDHFQYTKTDGTLEDPPDRGYGPVVGGGGTYVAVGMCAFDYSLLSLPPFLFPLSPSLLPFFDSIATPFVF